MNDTKEKTTLLVVPLERKVRGWQPMKTAPKDEIEILCITRHGDMYVVCYDDMFAAPWRVINEYGLNEEIPTHWMPLPEAPNVK